MSISKIAYFLLLFNTLTISNCNNEESSLRSYLFTEHDKLSRPVLNSEDTMNVTIGMAIQNLESFDQVHESMKLNVWLRTEWKDENLNWESSISNLSYITINDESWVHDVELLNAGGLPDVYIFSGGMYLYSDGSIIYSRPTIFTFGCSLDLHEFPFDRQECKMEVSSWMYNDELLYLKPYEDSSKRVDVLDSFSHSEWDIIGMKTQASKETRLCCGDKLYDMITYTIELERFPHYYKLSMGMTISLVIVSFIIMLINSDNISRTSTAVFIPLTILALQLTIADKIPVVG